MHDIFHCGKYFMLENYLHHFLFMAVDLQAPTIVLKALDNSIRSVDNEVNHFVHPARPLSSIHDLHYQFSDGKKLSIA